MLRGTLTLMARALREGARHRRAHATRVLSILVVLGMLIEAHASSGGIGAPGLRLFRSICLLSVALITLAGLGFFASVISEEKEEGTLGLLKLADLSTLSILLGKSTSRLAGALVLFAGQLPFALLAITLGGLTAHQVWSAYVAMAAYLVLVANVALLCSVLCRRTATASIVVALLLGGALWLAPLLQGSRAALERGKLIPVGGALTNAGWGAVDFVAENSILRRLDEILSTGFSEPAFGVQVWSSLGASLLLFAAACLLFDTFTEYAGAPSGSRSGGFLRGTRSWRGISRPWRWALVWKDFHFLAGGPLVLGLKGVVYGLLLVLLYFQIDRFWVLFYVSFQEAAWTAVVLIAVIELLLCATRILHSERVERTLPCLLLLPRNVASIAYAKLAGCLLGSVPTAMMVIGLVVVLPRPPGWIENLLEEGVPVGMAFLVLLHLTTFYSLVVRWGALPLAIATLLVGGTCVTPVLAAVLSTIYTAGQGVVGGVGPVVYAGIGLSAALQVAIGVRLHVVAAE